MTGQLIEVSDIGGQAGTIFRSDGTNYYPIGGSTLLLNRVGSSITPVASITGAGAAILFGAPLAGLKVPAGLLIPGKSRIRVEGYWVKTGAAAGINCLTFLGKTNSLSDQQSGNQFIGAAANAVWRQCTDLFFDTTTSCVESNVSVAVGASSGAVTTNRGVTNIDTTVDMFFNFGSSSNTAGDGINILSMSVTLFQ